MNMITIPHVFDRYILNREPASPTCTRCLEPNRITHRAISDEMDMRICFNCALEAWKCMGPLGRITLEVVE